MDSTISSLDLGRYRRLVQMLWDPEPVNDTDLDQPVWCLGRAYTLSMTNLRDKCLQTHDSHDAAMFHQHNAHEAPQSGKEEPIVSEPFSSARDETGLTSHYDIISSSTQHGSNTADSSWPKGFLEDFEARFWMTYRSNFEFIAKSTSPKAASALSLSMRIKSQIREHNGFTTDSGWGCMIRSGQSLLANAMAFLELGREWRRGMQPADEKRLVAQFADDPRAPYSIHNFVRSGESGCGKYPGEWFGPSATARCIQELVNSRGGPLRVYSTGDGPDIYEDEFMKIAKAHQDTFSPTLILVGTRLGIDRITPVYWEALIASVQMAQSVGIAGGRPSSSHYFVGSQGHFLFYLDPHHTRKALPYRSTGAQYSDEEIATCHTSRLRRVHVKEMDPSMLIGFLIRDEADWVDWKKCVKHVQGKTIIHVADAHPANEAQDPGQRSAIDEVEILSDDEDDEPVIVG